MTLDNALVSTDHTHICILVTLVLASSYSTETVPDSSKRNTIAVEKLPAYLKFDGRGRSTLKGQNSCIKAREGQLR